ncbi:helix-turn-helix domain-containing protein [Herbidospora mongoliensis]|uniref:helix-turn-helix domain-containing protein n=1 Tax=Herbidospora mongoliensis TaxID=688067 RepID=UPI00082D6D53|nr:helix-turn-helix domain-containing protein [Herbidospora mongoliensis]
MDETWTIAELAERATTALAGLAPANGRIRDVPNERLIRYYTTIGLLDPPLARRGRVALYGRRHLLQLVAVKRRQAEGVSIAAIQAELVGATNAHLAELAGTADSAKPAGSTSDRASRQAGNGTAPTTPAEQAPAARRAPPPAPAGAGQQEALPSPNGLSRDAEPDPAQVRSRFWAARPAAAVSVDQTAAQSEPVSALPRQGFPFAFHGVGLTSEAALLLTRPLTDDERAAVTLAAQPLIDLLTDLGFSEGTQS